VDNTKSFFKIANRIHKLLSHLRCNCNCKWL